MEEQKKKTEAMPNSQIVIITGMSGAGKTQAIKALEDMGWFCIDNLPPLLFEKFIETLNYGLGTEKAPKLAIAADIRSGVESLPELEHVLASLRAASIDYRLVFLDASDAVLLRRYKENRRPHPLQRSGSSTSACIERERHLLQDLRGQADIVIDTTNGDSHMLTERLITSLRQEENNRIAVSVVSFGFKYGVPTDCDLIMDVRFLPNPYYVPELKNLTGLDKPVADFVIKHEPCREFLRRYMHLLYFLLPHYQKEGKKNLTIGIGCTGGQHRSAAIAAEVSRRLRRDGYVVALDHRDSEMWHH